MSYCEYIVEIIDQLICQQETCLHDDKFCSSKSSNRQIVTNTCTNTDFQVPCFIEDVLSHKMLSMTNVLTPIF